MKSKLFIMAALCSIGFAASAQTEKGKSFINGSIGLSNNDSDGRSASTGGFGTKSSAHSIAVMPRYGYFVANNWAVGIGLGYQYNKNTTTSQSPYTTPSVIIQTARQHTFKVNPFVRKYVDVAEKFKFFGELNAAIGFGKTNDENISFPNGGTTKTDNKFTTYNASLNPGFAFFPSKRWAIEFSFPLVGYNKFKPKTTANGSTSSAESFSFATSSFDPSIGFNFHF